MYFRCLSISGRASTAWSPCFFFVCLMGWRTQETYELPKKCSPMFLLFFCLSESTFGGILNFTHGTCGISCNICNMSWFWSFCASTPPTVVVGRRMNRSRFPDFASNRTKKKSRRKVLATEMEIRFFAVRVLYQAWRCQVVAYKLNLKEMFVISISKLSQILTFPPFVGVCFEESGFEKTSHLHFA